MLLALNLTTWPQVHLVSEHVWCEDYLVRSLYLKNSQTGETRTVTQFHFLSWPDGTIPTSTRAILEFRRSVPPRSVTVCTSVVNVVTNPPPPAPLASPSLPLPSKRA